MIEPGCTTRPTHLRIACDSVMNDEDRWILDGVDDAGLCTPDYWAFGSHAECVDAMPRFVETLTTSCGVTFDWRSA